MKKKLLLIIFSAPIFAFSQFAVGHTTITFNDPARTGGTGTGGGPGRQIQTEIYYPSATTGDNLPVSNGSFPVIVFGHGFAMAWDAYQNIWEDLVAEGYILAFPRTEGSLFPSPVHADFGLDLAQVSNKILALNSTVGSIFENKINGNAAIMGHSMGGGATFLAAANNSNIKTIVGLAPAETNPSSIAAAANVSVPTLVFSGSEDGVTPPASNHIPIYDAVSGSCKYYINILGGAHCYFANTNFNCDFGEATSSTGISIQRAVQQQVLTDYVLPWFDYYLKENCAAWNTFVSLQTTDSRIQANNICANTISEIPIITLLSNILNSSITTNIQWFLNGNILVGETFATCPLTYGNGNYTVVSNVNPNCDATSLPYNYQNGTSGIDEFEDIQFTIQPNPASKYFAIKSSNTIDFETTIFSIEGKLIFKSQNISKIETNSWKKGIYIVQIASNGIIFTTRLSIE
jgi:dienelactone hydrolase